VERGHLPQGPSYSQAGPSGTHGSSAEELGRAGAENPTSGRESESGLSKKATLCMIFDLCCDGSGSVCPCSSWGLFRIKNNPDAKKLYEKEIGTLPDKAVPGCKKYGHTDDEKRARRPALFGLLRHAKAKMGRVSIPEEDDDYEEEEEKRLLHERLFHYLESRQDPAALESQLHSNMAGERAQNKAEKRKLVEDGEQERKRREGVEQQLHREREHQREREKAHQRDMAERDEKHRRVMDDSNRNMQLLQDEFGKGVFDEALQVEKQTRKLEAEKRQALEQAEAEKRQALEQAEAQKQQLQMELNALKRGQKILQEKRRAELAETLMEVQQINRELEKKREVELKKREDELETKLARKEKECAQLMDDNEDWEIGLHLNGEMVAQNRALQTRQDALFFVGLCGLADGTAASGTTADGSAAGLRATRKLASDTLAEVWSLPHNTTITQVGEVVRRFLESSDVKLEAIQAGAARLNLSRSNKKQLIELIMEQIFK